jgi:hypothetical protein
MHRLRAFVFRLYEQRRLRDWFYTIAFVIFVPVGYRFATLAWRYGLWVDKPLAVIAGLFIGITTVVTLMRFWHVPPRQIVMEAVGAPVPVGSVPARRGADEFLAAVRGRAAWNRSMASSAGVLGSTTGKNL